MGGDNIKSPEEHMLWSNIKVEPRETEIPTATLRYFLAGGTDRGERFFRIYDGKKALDEIVEGENNVGIALSKKGNPTVVPSASAKGLWLLIDSYGDYSRRRNGSVAVSDTEAVRVIARGNGADGDAGRIGQWDVLLVEVLKDCVVKIIPSGHYEHCYPRFLVIKGGKVLNLGAYENYLAYLDDSDDEEVFDFFRI